MIISIVLKEFYNNLISARFAIGFLLCLLLIPLTLEVNIRDYQGKVTAYETQKKEAAERLKIRTWSYLRPRIVREPEPLSILSRGVSYKLGNQVDVTLHAKPFKASGKAAASDNPLMSTYFSVDFCTTLAIILSLLALLFTYDACSGEREQGTLKLVLANSIPRSSVLLGKMLGACLTLMPIILFCYLLSALMIVLSPHVAFSADDWLRMGLILLASIIYFATFAFLGLFVSSMFRHSAASIVVCLLSWVFFLFVVPNLSGYLAGSLVETASQKKLGFATKKLYFEIWKEARKLRGKNPKGEFSFQWSGSGEADGAREILGATPDFLEWLRKSNKQVYNHVIEGAERRWLLEKEFLDKQDRQRLLAERLSMISPSQVFRLLCSSLSRTDVESYKRFMDSTRRYREELIRFFRNGNLFESYKFITPLDPEQMMTADELIRYCTDGRMQSIAELGQWRRDHPDVSRRGFLRKEPPSPDPASLPLLDLSGVPPYKGVPGGVALSLRDSLVKLAILACVGVLLFYLAFIAFLRYDVR